MEQKSPEAVVGGGLTRRGFLKVTSGFLAGLIGLVLAVPLIGSLFGSVFERSRSYFAPVGKIDGLPVGQPVNLNFPFESVDAFLRSRISRHVWVIKHSSTDLTVFSPICTHLGCHYMWDAERQEFVCPCHGSFFTVDGKVVGGPAPRPLDTLAYEIRDGELLVKWEEFNTGAR